MNILDQLDAVIVRDTLAELRRDAERQEIVNRVYRVPEEAVAAYHWAQQRRNARLRDRLTR
jgi:hypothetical protein